jgi:acetoin utilization deacetylase AcuC-like enzyme
MTTALFTHNACNGHLTPDGHPERVARLHAVMDGLGSRQFAALDRRSAPLVKVEAIERAHSRAHVEDIAIRAKAAGPTPVQLEDDTSICEGSWEAALRAAGAATSAVDAVMAGEVDNAFCAVRPPGHHAEPDVAMGFCLFNSIAIAALHAQEVHRLSKVAVVDFDIHHGNGTQAVFVDRPNCFYASSHQMPLYPGTGEPASQPNIINVPLRPGTSSQTFRAAWERQIFPALEAFEPELLLISAGFDGHKFDPLAQCELDDEDYSWITRQLLDLSKILCGGRLVSMLEGGYDLGALKGATIAHVEELMKA